MIYLTGSLGPTASQARREYAYLNVGNDGRDGTIFLSVWHAHRRHNTAVFTSTYSVGEVEAVGFAGREDGEVTCVVSCGCMASGCNAPCCRHKDLIQELLAQGAFDETQTEYHNGHGTEAHQRTEQEANCSPRDAWPYADRDGEEARREAPRLPVLRERGRDARACANPHFANQTEPLLTNSRTISEFS